LTDRTNKPKEIVMNPSRPIRRIAAVLVGLAAALVAFATPAFAMPMPIPGGGGPAVAPPHVVPVRTLVAGGMPGWQITLIAAGTAVLAAIVAVLLDRARATRRSPVIGAA
jgi:hypothetical protein